MSSQLPCKISTYAYDYSPPDVVKVYHGIPHLTQSLTASTANFTDSGGGEGFVLTDYAKDISGLFYVIFIVGCSSVAVFQLITMLRGDYLKGGPASFAIDKPAGWQLRAVRRKNFLFILYNVFLGLIFLSNHYVFMDYAGLMAGATHVQTRWEAAVTLTEDMGAVSFVASLQLSRVDRHINATVCGSSLTKDALFNAQASVASFDAALLSMEVGLEDLQAALQPDLSSGAARWAGASTLETNTYASVFGLYGLMLIVVLLFALFPCCQLDVSMKVATLGVEVLVLALTAVWCLEAVSLVTMADFCMDPDASALAITAAAAANGGGSVSATQHQLLKYYADCAGAGAAGGTSMLHEDLQAALTEAVSLQAHLQGRFDDAGDACAGSGPLAQALVILDELHSNLDYLACTLSCDAIADRWSELVHVAFCSEFLPGFGAFWLQKVLLAVFCFALICTGSVLYEYFGLWWNLKTYSVFPDSPDDDEVHSGDGHAADRQSPRQEEPPRRRKSRASNDRRRSFSEDEGPKEDGAGDLVSPFDAGADSDSDEGSRSRSRTVGGRRKYRGPDMVADPGAQREHKEQDRGSRASSRDGGSRAGSRRGSFDGARRKSIDGGAASASRRSTPDISEKHLRPAYVNPTPAPGPLHGHLPRPYMQVRRTEEVPKSITHKKSSSKLEDFD